MADSIGWGVLEQLRGRINAIDGHKEYHTTLKQLFTSVEIVVRRVGKHALDHELQQPMEALKGQLNNLDRLLAEASNQGFLARFVGADSLHEKLRPIMDAIQTHVSCIGALLPPPPPGADVPAPALSAGTLTLTIERAEDLKNMDWFKEQDPFCVVKVGNKTPYRTKTDHDGGKNPVWNESFTFNIIDENTAELELYDHDTGRSPEFIGSCQVDMSQARSNGSDRVRVPVRTANGKQQGYVIVSISFRPH